MPRLVVLTDPAGTVLRSDAAGVTILSVTGWDRSAPLQHDTQKRWGHGSITGSSSREGRKYVIRGRHSDLSESDVYATKQMVQGLFAGLASGELQVTDPDGVTRSAAVRLDGEILADALAERFGWFDWEIPLLADDPYRYGEARSVLLTPAGTGVGMVFPLFAPSGVLSFGSAVNSLQQLNNGGDAKAWPVFDVSVSDPSGFRIVMDGRVVEYGAPCVAGAPVQLDMRGSASVGGVDNSAALRRREWAAVPPKGTSTVELQTLQGGTGSAWATVRDTWI